MDAADLDGNGTRESLQIVTGTSVQVIVVGQFGEYLDFTRNSSQQGRMEQLVFGNGAFISGEGKTSASSKEDLADTVKALIDASTPPHRVWPRLASSKPPRRDCRRLSCKLGAENEYRRRL